MTDPPRLIDDSPSELESALLQVGREYRAPANTHTKTLAALGLVGSSALLAKSSAAASFWSLKSLIVGGAVVGVVATSAIVVTSNSRPQEPAPALVADASSAEEPTTQAATPLPTEASAPEAEPEPEPVASETATGPAPSTKTARAASITEELQAIDAARSAVAAGDGARALKLLDDHARRFPRGRLHLEAEVLRIEALARSGNRAAATTRARAFVKRHPNSVFTPRVRRIAGE